MPKKPWNLAVLSDGSGMAYAISRPQVEDDYAEYLMQVEGISLGHATERARDSHEAIDTWVREQFNHHDFKQMGIPLTRPTYQALLNGSVAINQFDLTLRLLRI